LAAFLIIEIAAVRDPRVYANYRGTYLVRGGQVKVLEGDWRPNRMVVLHFDSADEARRWWNSSSYAELKAMRQRSTKTNTILVEGVSNA